MQIDSQDLSQETKLTIVKIAARKMREGDADPALAERLDALSLSELESFCRALPVTIDISAEMLEGALRRAAQSRRSALVQREFVRRGASNRMMHRLFRVSKLQVERIRRDERASGKLVGRPRMPDADEREAIVAEWADIRRREPDARRRYLELARRFVSHTLATLQRVVEEGEQAEEARRDLARALLD